MVKDSTGDIRFDLCPFVQGHQWLSRSILYKTCHICFIIARRCPICITIILLQELAGLYTLQLLNFFHAVFCMTICLGQIEFRIFFAGAGAFGGESYFSTFLRWKNVKILFSLENYNNISAEAKQSYQFVHSTWFDMKKKYNFPCFVENVKKIILYLIFYSKFLWIWSTTLFEKLLVSK